MLTFSLFIRAYFKVLIQLIDSLHMSTKIALKFLSVPSLHFFFSLSLLAFLFFKSLRIRVLSSFVLVGFWRFFEAALLVDGEIGGRNFAIAMRTFVWIEHIWSDGYNNDERFDSYTLKISHLLNKKKCMPINLSEVYRIMKDGDLWMVSCSILSFFFYDDFSLELISDLTAEVLHLSHFLLHLTHLIILFHHFRWSLLSFSPFWPFFS